MLDPFAGSGTTLVQSLESGRLATGVDVAGFNCLLMRVKTRRHNLDAIRRDLLWAHEQASAFEPDGSHARRRDAVRARLVRAARGGRAPPLPVARSTRSRPATCCASSWRAPRARRGEPPTSTSTFPGAADRAVLVSQAPPNLPPGGGGAAVPPPLHARHARSNRDASPRSASDGAHASVQHGDARELDLGGPFDAVVTSPPYPGLIDYHEQHRYAYELLGLDERREAELGRPARGVGREAIRAYVEGVADVLANAREHLAPGAPVCIVVNDRRDLTPRSCAVPGCAWRTGSSATSTGVRGVVQGSTSSRSSSAERPDAARSSLSGCSQRFVHACPRVPRQGGHMRRLIKHRPSPAMVVACIALGRRAHAERASQPSPRSRRTPSARRRSRPNAVTAAKIKNRNVTGAKLARNAVTGSQVLNGSLTRVGLRRGLAAEGPRRARWACRACRARRPGRDDRPDHRAPGGRRRARRHRAERRLRHGDGDRQLQREREGDLRRNRLERRRRRPRAVDAAHDAAARPATNVTGFRATGGNDSGNSSTFTLYVLCYTG